LQILIAPPCLSADAAPRQVTLAAVGDVLFARGVGMEIALHGAGYPFKTTQKIIRAQDLAFCNLECVLSNGGTPHQRLFNFRADPGVAKSLRRGGFTIASLANNHALDYGRESLLDTIAATKSAGVIPVGAGVNRADALSVRVVSRHGLRVGFVAYSDFPTAKFDDRPTIAGVNSDEIPGQIREAKSKCDVLVVSFHWGVEYKKTPTERQQMLAHLCIDNGADLILGHHPHVLQPVEVYKGKPIAYSMGGFIWDSHLSGADKSAIYIFNLGRSSAKLVREIPVRSVKSRPVLE